jgi:hypothetical protein
MKIPTARMKLPVTTATDGTVLILIYFYQLNFSVRALYVVREDDHGKRLQQRTTNQRGQSYLVRSG